MAFVYNWTTQDFTYPWASIPYTLKAGTVYQDVLTADDGQTKILLVPGIAQHFAKHLADRAMSQAESKLTPENRKTAWNLAEYETHYKKALEMPPAAPAPVVEEKKEKKEKMIA